VDRRTFLKLGAGAGAAALARPAKAGEPVRARDDPIGVLMDTTRCIGCRACEDACNRANALPRPEKPFSDQWVLNQPRRPTAEAFTVVNRYEGRPSPDQRDRDRTTVKVQCMHCADPACVSACLVAAMHKRPDGPVVYDSSVCMGCRYCMVACPFEIPAYEYMDPLTPRVRKCTLCTGPDGKDEPAPACAATCPTEALVAGTRGELLALARARQAARPDRYLDVIYGEDEVGGTSWLYLVGRPPEEVDLPDLPEEAPPRLTEAIQHGIFRYGAAPIAVYAGLAGMMWLTNRGKGGASPAGGGDEGHGGQR